MERECTDSVLLSFCILLSELEDRLVDIESRLKWDDESRRDWYLERKAEVTVDLKRYRQEHDIFINEYGEIIYS